MRVVGRWWNRRFGRIARRDVWLNRNFDDENQARLEVQGLLVRRAAEWRDLTGISCEHPATRKGSQHEVPPERSEVADGNDQPGGRGPDAGF